MFVHALEGPFGFDPRLELHAALKRTATRGEARCCMTCVTIVGLRLHAVKPVDIAAVR
jgi:hypothetical protein